MRCYHYRAWLIAGGNYEWCYECGALRRLRPSADGSNYSVAETQWTKPTGKDGKNPFPMKQIRRNLK